MSEPGRLLAGSEVTPFERDLLESWSSEQPPAAARALAMAGVRVAAIVGAAGTAAASTAAASTAAAGMAGSAAGATGAASAPKVGFGLAMLLKWGSVGVIVGATAVTVAVVRQPDGAPPEGPEQATSPSPVIPVATPGTVTTPGSNGTVSSPAQAPGTPPVGPPDHRQAQLLAVPPVSPPIAQRKVEAPPGLPTRASLAQEIAMFDHARAALEEGEADRALALLDAYQSRFRAGAFSQEAEELRVQALLRKGDRGRAARVGQRFLAAHPESPHAARVRALLAPSDP